MLLERDGCVSVGALMLSILYLRCKQRNALATYSTTSLTFNSLFEMRRRGRDMQQQHLDVLRLSILYLRCLIRRAAVRRSVEGMAFNSLFEMQKQPSRVTS